MVLASDYKGTATTVGNGYFNTQYGVDWGNPKASEPQNYRFVDRDKNHKISRVCGDRAGVSR